jgi:hypothetical protein
MSRVKLVCALMLCVLAMPTAAGAQEGNGPYAPFPSAPDDGAGDAWYALMGAEIPPEQLERGVFAGELRPAAGAAPGTASARAGVDASGIGAGALLAAFALVTVGCGAGAVAARRRSSSPAKERA